MLIKWNSVYHVYIQVKTYFDLQVPGIVPERWSPLSASFLVRWPRFSGVKFELSAGCIVLFAKMANVEGLFD
jgi:hypothetical protein